MSLSNVCVGITCYNRPRFYYETIKSIADLKAFDEVLILDDASTEIDHRVTLRHIENPQIFRLEKNSGRADFSIRLLMILFLQKSTRRYLFLLDSDLIIDNQILDVLPDLLRSKFHSGIFSLFNTDSHPGTQVNEVWLRKPHIGSAGVIFDRALLKRIAESVPPSTKYDWDWSAFLQSQGIPILCTARSYVQHLGIHTGQNSTHLVGDYGNNFEDMSPRHTMLIIEELYKTVKDLQIELRKLRLKSRL